MDQDVPADEVAVEMFEEVPSAYTTTGAPPTIADSNESALKPGLDTVTGAFHDEPPVLEAVTNLQDDVEVSQYATAG